MALCWDSNIPPTSLLIASQYTDISYMVAGMLLETQAKAGPHSMVPD